MGENKSETLYFDLNPGDKIPSVGLGTWKAEPGLVSRAVIAAVKVHSPYKLWYVFILFLLIRRISD